MTTFDNLNEIYSVLTSKPDDGLSPDAIVKLNRLLTPEMIKLLKSIQTTFNSLNGLKDKNEINEIHVMIQRKIDPISATGQMAENIINNNGIGEEDKATLLKSYMNALHIININIARRHLNPKAALEDAVIKTGLSIETLTALGLFTSPFMGIVDLTVLGAFAIASPFYLLKKSAEFINAKYSERQERIAAKIEDQYLSNPDLYLNIPVGLIISDIDADIKEIESNARIQQNDAEREERIDKLYPPVNSIIAQNPEHNEEPNKGPNVSVSSFKRFQQEQNKEYNYSSPQPLAPGPISYQESHLPPPPPGQPPQIRRRKGP